MLQKRFNDIQTIDELTYEILVEEADRRAEMMAIHKYKCFLTDLPSKVYAEVINNGIESVIADVDKLAQKERNQNDDPT